jgi:hypothetical protein
VVFRPAAQRSPAAGDVRSRDGGQRYREAHARLDTLVGKILRIIPDPAEHAATSTLSDNGRYRIERQPFTTSPAHGRKLGLRP